MLSLKLDEKLLEDIGKDISSFVGKIIDISQVSDTFSSHLDIKWASSFGITRKDLSIQVAENRIRQLSSNANIQVVCFFKEQVEKETALIEQLLPSRIILFK